MIVTSHPEVILILTLEIGVQTEQFFLFALAANMLSSQLCCLMSGKDWKGTNVEDKKRETEIQDSVQQHNLHVTCFYSLILSVM